MSCVYIEALPIKPPARVRFRSHQGLQWVGLYHHQTTILLTLPIPLYEPTFDRTGHLKANPEQAVKTSKFYIKIEGTR
jgi:hypothetical protein